jgi:hypothetical protein
MNRFKKAYRHPFELISPTLYLDNSYEDIKAAQETTLPTGSPLSAMA